jgi:hypothetical protein
MGETMFSFLSQFFLGEPPQPRDFDIGAIYHSPNLHAFFMFGLILLCMCLVPLVMTLWKAHRQVWATALGLVAVVGVVLATGGVYASGYSEAKYPNLQGAPGKKTAAAGSTTSRTFD